MERKPLAPAESRDPHSIRFTPSEWRLLTDRARATGTEVTTYVRECALIGDQIRPTLAAMQSYSRASA